MRIAVACESLTTVACHLGRARLFLIYDTVAGKPELVDQRANPQADCDRQDQPPIRSGHESVLALVGDCMLVVARGMGSRIAADLREHGIRPVLLTEDAPPFAAARVALQQGGDARAAEPERK
jgi:predicted Fe-Mo cluster-binding NifX family protein